MKNKDKKVAQYEIENRKIKKEMEYCSSHFMDYMRILQSGGPKTKEEEKLVKRVGEHYREKTDEEMAIAEDKAIKMYIALHNAAETKKEEALKRKRFERAMKAAADKKKKEQEKTE